MQINDKKINLTFDFETRSCVDITKTSTRRYAEDETTEVLCMAVKVNSCEPKWWAPDWVVQSLISRYGGENRVRNSFISKSEVIELFSKADTYEAHNAEFEDAIWENQMVTRHGFPPLDYSKIRCSAAKCAMHALPRSLGAACEALDLPIQKDKEGHKLMMKMCRPISPLKKDYEMIEGALGLSYKEAKVKHSSREMKTRWYSGPGDKKYIRWHDSPDQLHGLIKYCLIDVESEHGLSSRLKDLSANELKVWQMDQCINRRGVPVDQEGIKAFGEMVSYANQKLLAEFSAITRGEVKTPRQQVFKEWLKKNGVLVANLQADTLKAALACPATKGRARLALKLREQLGLSSVAKVEAFMKCTSADGRAKSTLMYHGATTGRWTAKGIQLQNVPRGDIKTPEQVETCIDMVKAKDYGFVDMFYGGMLSATSSCLRGLLMASEGHDFICSDFSAIEGRVLAWLAGDEPVLQNYRDGKDAYCSTAEMCFGVDYQWVKDNHESDKTAWQYRFWGKTGELGCGFGGSINALKRFAPDMQDKQALEIVTKWRAARQPTVKFWYALTDALADAMESPGKTINCGKLNFKYRREYGFLMCRLPSGRLIYYPMPEMVKSWFGPGEEAKKAFASVGSVHEFGRKRIKAISKDIVEVHDTVTKETKLHALSEIGGGALWRKEGRVVSAMTVDSLTKKWVRRDLTVPIISENVTQATARDLMAHNMLDLEEAGYPLVLSVHDEIISEILKNFGSVEEFERIMSHAPEWAKGLPLAASGGWRGKRYKK